MQVTAQVTERKSVGMKSDSVKDRASELRLTLQKSEPPESDELKTEIDSQGSILGKKLSVPQIGVTALDHSDRAAQKETQEHIYITKPKEEIKKEEEKAPETDHAAKT